MGANSMIKSIQKKSLSGILLACLAAPLLTGCGAGAGEFKVNTDKITDEQRAQITAEDKKTLDEEQGSQYDPSNQPQQ